MAVVEPQTRTLHDGTRIIVRSADAADVPALMALERTMHDTSPHMIRALDEIETDPAKCLERITSHTEDAGKLFLVATTDDQPPAPERPGLIGNLSVRAGQFRILSHRAEFGISVAGPWRGRGVGSALVGAMMDWAAAHPAIEKVCLCCFASNAGARRLYERLGFVVEGVQLKHLRRGDGRYEDDLQMSMWVKPGPAPDGFATWPIRAD